MSNQIGRPQTEALLFAGLPEHDMLLFRQTGFMVHDPAVWVGLPNGERHLIVRNIEMRRASQKASADHVHCPEHLVTDERRSGDREVAFAQAAMVLLRKLGVKSVAVHRGTPALVTEMIRMAGIDVRCESNAGVMERRAKDANEIQALRRAQAATAKVIKIACEMIAKADTADDGSLVHGGSLMTSQTVKSTINRLLIDEGMGASNSIVAGGEHAADPHHQGEGVLKSGQAIIVDVFPRDRETMYCGDCTRVVVHGEASQEIVALYEAVTAAKHKGIEACKAGATGEDVHKAATAELESRGYVTGGPDPEGGAAMTHGTGHGVGLAVHEPPLLDFGGPELIVGDCVTIEPGLYKPGMGGVRSEDMVIVTQYACENLTEGLHEGLDWG